MSEVNAEVLQKVKTLFPESEVNTQRKNGIQVKLKKDQVTSVLSHLKDHLGFVHLSHIACVDWLEQGEFEIVYILWNYETKTQFYGKLRVPRENGSALSIRQIWRQADTYEREMTEMYGIPFEGNENPRELILEDWEELPPMRRDFDTQAFVKEAFYERPGREDAKDVRSIISGRSGEDIPDIAWKYSR